MEYAELLSALDRTQFHLLEPEPSVHIVLPDSLRDLSWAAAALRSAPWRGRAPRPILEAHVAETQAGALELDQLEEVGIFLATLEAKLLDCQVPVRYSGEAELDAVMSEAAWVILPTTSSMPKELLETVEFGLRRGAPLSIGPHVPSSLREIATRRAAGLPFALRGTGHELEEQIEMLVYAGQLPRHDATPESVRIFFHTRPGTEQSRDQLAVAFVQNLTAEAVNAEFACPGYRAMDAVSQKPIASFAERLQLTVPPQGIRMLELIPD
jgi:hypothetical protein